MSKVLASTSFTQCPQADMPRFLALFGDDVTKALNGGLDFATNFNAQTISVTFASANVDTTTAHTLNRVPTGYIVVGATAAMSVYDGSVASSSSTIVLRSSAIGTARILIY